MHLNSPYIQFQDNTYSHPILYGEYINHTLYLIHPDKKIALNIQPEKLDEFIQDLAENIQSLLLYIKSFELRAKQNQLKIKKRKKLLPDAIILVPSQINQTKVIDTTKDVQFTPINNLIHFDYPRPEKKNFINQIQQLQHKLDTKKSEINFKYTYHSKQTDQEILSEQNFKTPFFFKSPDFTILSETINTQNENKLNTNQDILFTEDHPRDFQKGVLKIYTPTKTTTHLLKQSTEIIQTNVQKNLTKNINNQTKPFQIYKQLCSKINQHKSE